MKRYKVTARVVFGLVAENKEQAKTKARKYVSDLNKLLPSDEVADVPARYRAKVVELPF